MRRRSLLGEQAQQRFEFVAQVLDLSAAIRRDRHRTRFADGEHAARMAGAVCCMTVAAGHFLETLARPADRAALFVEPRSEELRVGEECVSPCSSRWLTLT